MDQNDNNADVVELRGRRRIMLALKDFAEMAEDLALPGVLWHGDERISPRCSSLRRAHHPVMIICQMWKDELFRPQLEQLVREYLERRDV